MPPPTLRHRLLIIAAAVLFSTGGAAIKAATFGPWQIACFRSGIAAVFLLAAIPESRRSWSWRMLPVAGCYAATLIFFVLANRLTSSANAIFLQSAAPLYLLLIGPLVLHEPITRRDVAFVAAVICGIALIFVRTPHAASTATDPARGNLYAVASGLMYALMLAGMRWFSRPGKPGSAVAIVAMGNVVACLAALPLALPVNAIGVRDAVVLGYLGTVQIGIAYLCLSSGIRHVPAVQATTLLMAEPALNPLWTWLVHKESPGVWALAGGALIISATLWNTWQSARD